jgi:hypothetical protein
VHVLDPAAAPDPPSRARVTPLGDLRGRRLGFRVEWANFDLLCDELEALLGADAAARRWNLVREARLASGAIDWLPRRETELAAFAEGIDAAVVGLADGGSSTYWNVQDWVALQLRGVPAVVVVADAYERQARILALLEGYGEIPLVRVPHPFHVLTHEQVKELAPRVASEVRALL